MEGEREGNRRLQMVTREGGGLGRGEERGEGTLGTGVVGVKIRKEVDLEHKQGREERDGYWYVCVPAATAQI